MSAGYGFVPLPDRVRRTDRKHAVLDRRCPGTFSGRLDLVFEAEQPVHIGSGLKGLVDGNVIRRAARIGDRPGIPGSSMKGVLRSRYEAITYSCAGRAPSRGPSPSMTFGAEMEAEFTSDVRDLAVFQPCKARSPRAPAFLCPACAFFGRMSQRSRITITDLVCAEGRELEQMQIHEQFAPRLHHVGKFRHLQDRKVFQIFRLEGRKFARGLGPIANNAKAQMIEVIPTGSVLHGQIRLYNTLPEELGGLLGALGSMPPSALKIGGGKGRGFGRIRLTGIAWHLRDAGGGPVPPNETGWRASFEHCSDRWADGEQALVRLHQGDC